MLSLLSDSEYQDLCWGLFLPSGIEFCTREQIWINSSTMHSSIFRYLIRIPPYVEDAFFIPLWVFCFHFWFWFWLLFYQKSITHGCMVLYFGLIWIPLIKVSAFVPILWGFYSQSSAVHLETRDNDNSGNSLIDHNFFSYPVLLFVSFFVLLLFSHKK